MAKHATSIMAKPNRSTIFYEQYGKCPKISNTLLHTYYIPPHDSGRVLWFHIECQCVCQFILPSYLCLYFHFWMITSVNCGEFSPNLVCTLISWRSCLGLLICKFHPFLTVICIPPPPPTHTPNVHI